MESAVRVQILDKNIYVSLCALGKGKTSSANSHLLGNNRALLLNLSDATSLGEGKHGIKIRLLHLKIDLVPYFNSGGGLGKYINQGNRLHNTISTSVEDLRRVE